MENESPGSKPVNKLKIGRKIVECRKEKKITLTELSRQTNLSVSMLSQIEHDLANPSLNTLNIIASVLEVPIFQFFISGEPVDSMVLRKRDRIRVHQKESSNSYYELLTPNTKGRIEFALMTLQQSEPIFDKFLSHRGEEVAIVTKGKLQIVFEDKTVILKAGDSVRIPPYTKHQLINPSKVAAEVIFAISPPSL